MHLLDKRPPPFQRKIEGYQLRQDSGQKVSIITIIHREQAGTDVSLNRVKPPRTSHVEIRDGISAISTLRNVPKICRRFSLNQLLGGVANGCVDGFIRD